MEHHDHMVDAMRYALSRKKSTTSVKRNGSYSLCGSVSYLLFGTLFAARETTNLRIKLYEEVRPRKKRVGK